MYREVTTRTVQHDASPGYQVQYLSAANPTTVVSERASSPGMELLVSSTILLPFSCSSHQITDYFLMNLNILLSSSLSNNDKVCVKEGTV
jgi:hypothetical protein